MKSKKIVKFLLSTLFLLASCSGSGEGGNSSETRPDFPDSNRTRTHTCMSICDVCGGCLNHECEKQECVHKCCDNLEKNLQVFEAEDNRVQLYGGIGISGVPGLKGETYVGGINANPGAELQFYFTSNKAVRADLYVSVSKRSSKIVFGDTMSTVVNGTKIGGRGHIGIKEEDEWGEFSEVGIGCFNFNEGINQVIFTCINSDASQGFNFDHFALRTSDNVSFELVSPDAYINSNKVDSKFEAETPNESNALTYCGGDDSIWRIDDNNFSGGAYLGHIYDASLANPGKYYLNYNIEAPKAGIGQIYFFVGCAAEILKGALILYVNGTKVNCINNWPETGGWTVFDGRAYGYVYLKEGENKLSVYIGVDAILNMDYFVIAGSVSLSPTV